MYPFLSLLAQAAGLQSLLLQADRPDLHAGADGHRGYIYHGRNARCRPLETETQGADLGVHPLFRGGRVAHLLPSDDRRASAFPEPCADLLPQGRIYRPSGGAVRLRAAQFPQDIQKGVRNVALPMADDETGGEHQIQTVANLYPYCGHHR